MNTKQCLTAVISVISFWVSASLLKAEGEISLEEIQNLGAENPKEALVEARRHLESLRAKPDLQEDERDAIGYAAMVAGRLASRVGEHEEAVELLREGLPVYAKLRKGKLWRDEFETAMDLVTSLEELKRSGEGLSLLVDLLERTRAGLKARGPAADLKLDVQGQGVELGEFLPRQEWLVTLLERIGTLHLERERWADAEVALKEAEVILKRIHPGENLGQLTKLQDGWEDAARKQGRKVRPRAVGRFGNPHAIRIEGAREITKDEIYSALLRSSGFVLSSHPSSGFDAFLEKVESCLERGYRSSGFAEVVVKVEWDEEQDEVVARIKEGVRYRMGEIRIAGSNVVTAEKLREGLTWRAGKTEKASNRAEITYRAIEKEKRLPQEVVKKATLETFPWLAAAQKPETPKPREGQDSGQMANLNSMFESTGDSSKDEKPAGPWKPGKPADYRPQTLNGIKNLLFTTYAEEGRLGPRFEVEWLPKKEDGIVDLDVVVKEEGSSLRLGKIHVMGNTVNTREELLEFLELKKGMPIGGGFTDRLRRKFYESGRFMGWELVLQRAQRNPEQVELLILVAEHWEAPPVLVPLSREQEALRKFAMWLNGKAMEESDLVVSGGLEPKSAAKSEVERIEFALGAEGMALAVDFLGGRRVRGVLESEGGVELFLQAGSGSFRTRSMVTKKRPAVTFFAADTVALGPIDQGYSFESPHPTLRTSGVRVWAGFSSVHDGDLVFGMDPATAVSKMGSYNGATVLFENGQVAITAGLELALRFEEAGGRLLELRGSDGGGEGRVVIKAETGAVERIREEARTLGGDTVPELDLESAASVGFAGMGALLHLVGDEEFREMESPEVGKILELVGEGVKRWAPLASMIGEFFDSLGNENDQEDQFLIPLEVQDFATMQGGNNLMILLSFGGYELLAQFVEPGTWPDQVLREALFFLAGRPHYLNDTVQNLLDDDSMGPFGSLLCAALVNQVGHGASRAFAEKARGQLTGEGFAKDWTLALRGTAEDNGPGWKLLKGLRDLKPGYLQGLLPREWEKAGEVIEELIAEVRAVEPQTTADALAPVMGRLWDVAEPEVVKQVEKAIENLTPRVNAREVAATVNGKNGFLRVYRGAVQFTDRLGSSMGLDQVAESGLEECLSYLLFAREIWNKGMSASPEMVKGIAEQLVISLGADGWDQVKKMGMTKEQCEEWVGALITGANYRAELVKRQTIEEEEVKAFYEARRDLFSLPKVLVHKIVLPASKENEAALAKVREKVSKSGGMEAMVAAFSAAGGVDYGEVDPSYEWSAPLAKAILRMPEKGLSEVIRVPGQLHLVLLPGARNPGEAEPFEEVAEKAKEYAIIDREVRRLKRTAQIDYIDEPGAEYVPPKEEKEPKEQKGVQELVKTAQGGLQGLVNAAGAATSSDDGKKKESDGSNGRTEDLEIVLEKAEEGSAKHLYLMGTYAEREIGEEKGMDAAIDRYQTAAKEGDRRAMLRLAEIYRVGRGVKPDEAMSQEWKEKAAAIAEQQPDPGKN